ncbi:MAG: NADH dehydrogenase subunit, partial [Candidatus Bathyarchaeia archaeon]
MTATDLIIGPQHPALHEPERFVLKLDGEYVVDVVPRIGYVHRGIEKAAELRSYIQDIYLIERICGICNVAHSL